MPDTVNETLVDVAVSHRIRLERLGGSYIAAVLKILRTSQKNVTDKLAERLVKIETRGFDAGPATTKRLQELLDDLNVLIEKGYTQAAKQLRLDLEELAVYESDFTRASIEDAMPVEWSMTAPATATLEALVTTTPIYGSLFDEWTSDLTVATQTRVREAIRSGVVEGQTTADIVRSIRGTKALNYQDGLLDISRRNAETWVRTSVANVAARAREVVMEENSDLVSSVKWVSTLDSRTSPICRARDGKVYEVGEGPRPPAHPNCRSTTVPILASASELGLPAGERASMDGQVPADLTFGPWLARQPREVVEDTLGPSRAALFLQGKLPIERFVREPDGHTYTLAELRKREAAAFKRAKL